MKTKFVAISFAFFMSFNASADQLNYQEIRELGSHTGQTIFMYLNSNVLTATYGCAYDVLYCPNTNPDCKAMLALAITAKVTSSKIYVAFDKDASNAHCNLSHVKLQ